MHLLPTHLRRATFSHCFTVCDLRPLARSVVLGASPCEQSISICAGGVSYRLPRCKISLSDFSARAASCHYSFHGL